MHLVQAKFKWPSDTSFAGVSFEGWQEAISKSKLKVGFDFDLENFLVAEVFPVETESGQVINTVPALAGGDWENPCYFFLISFEAAGELKKGIFFPLPEEGNPVFVCKKEFVDEIYYEEVDEIVGKYVCWGNEWLKEEFSPDSADALQPDFYSLELALIAICEDFAEGDYTRLILV